MPIDILDCCNIYHKYQTVSHNIQRTTLSFIKVEFISLFSCTFYMTRYITQQLCIDFYSSSILFYCHFVYFIFRQCIQRIIESKYFSYFLKILIDSSKIIFYQGFYILEMHKNYKRCLYSWSGFNWFMFSNIALLFIK